MPNVELAALNNPANGASHRPKTLNLSQYEFCLNYLANGFNATAAYKAAYPAATLRSARELGHRLLTKVDIKAFLSTQLGEAWNALHMHGDEAFARVAMDARADIRLLFDEKGDFLHPLEWPDEVANSVETVEFYGGGGVKRVRFVSKAAARRTILEQTGKLKSRVEDDVDALAEALRSNLERYAT
jgi:phage terminase small subunit